MLGAREKFVMPVHAMKALVKSAFRSMALDVRRWHQANTEEAALKSVLHAMRPSTVLDVGANVGQFAETIRMSVPRVLAAILYRWNPDLYRVVRGVLRGANDGETPPGYGATTDHMLCAFEAA